jgi:sulfate adenylyltransferase subunit 1 (EFTu-like GTPase family)
MHSNRDPRRLLDRAETTSRERGDGRFDFAPLTGGLHGAREPGITIDVADRLSTTPRGLP